MAISKTFSNIVDNVTRDSGPYIGIVKDNVDTQRLGILRVFIPQLSNNENDPKSWYPVMYLSPFYGYSDPYISNPKKPKKAKTATDSDLRRTKHSYGMWMVPPDIGVKVLVVFANGEVNKGFFIGCIPEGHSHFMVPSLGASDRSDFKQGMTAIPEKDRPAQVPVAEYNEENLALDIKNDWITNPKPLHNEQFEILRKQGLEFDYVRGAINSSSQRESPSTVFGISSPGRPYRDPTLEKALQDKIKSGQKPTAAELAFEGRKGGHTFVMDDGDATGNNNFFRLRSSAGHQILMHDSSDFIYISNSKGTAWIELNSTGDVEIYSGGNFSVRAEFDINLHADQNINMYAGKDINMLAENKFATECTTHTHGSKKNTTIHACGDLELKSGTKGIWDAGTTLGLKSGSPMNLQGSIINLNTADPGKVSPVADISRNSFSNAVQTSNRYKSIAKRISTITTRAPTHEPDVGHLARVDIAKVLADPVTVSNDAGRVPANGITTGSGGNLVDGNGNRVTFGPAPASDASRNKTPTSIKGMENLATYMGKQPKPAKGVGTLTADETKALYAGIAKSESGHNYAAVNQIGYLGKYQMGAAALVEQGYIKPEFYKKYGPQNNLLNNPDAWTGKDGVTSKDSFLAAPAAQEKAMEGLTATNYNRMVKTGAIQPGDDPATVAGMLQTAHLLGAGGATAWRNGKGGSDANGVTGDTYFAKGKYAIATLTKDGTSVA